MTQCRGCGRALEAGVDSYVIVEDGLLCVTCVRDRDIVSPRPRWGLPEHWENTRWRDIRDLAVRRERLNRCLFAVLWPILRAVGAVDRRLRWAEVRDQDWNRPRPRWRVWLTPKVAAVHEALQHFAARRVF